MNKETALLVEYINKSGYCLEKIEMYRNTLNNIKDFQVMLGYLVMEIVSEEKKLTNISRKNIDLPMLTKLYFERVNNGKDA